MKANLRFHHLKFDGNGLPMIKKLAETLYEYIIDFCISSKNRDEQLTPTQSARLVKQARALFRHPNISEKKADKTGEAGEALLFFLMEAVLGAPQIVAKMELKTNSNDEVKGSDGIHARWDPIDRIVDFYFGEAKLYKNISAAIKSALDSIDGFHENEMYKHEFSMVTKHFKYSNNEIKSAVSDLIALGEPGEGVRINHACLIGYDWNGYIDLCNVDHLLEDFRGKFERDFPRITEILRTKFSGFKHKHLKFDVFFIPFPSVSDFRDAFNKALD
ncbi:DUF1837 domain-containing protein [Yersinia enterocolitica]|nr:DUF1837 domain-containing protein [Yersinia enterocolitica]PJE84650.1 DUF1837 domain-containing protein [Yersinia kristensenii]